MTPAEALLLAANVIDEKGFWRGKGYGGTCQPTEDQSGACCAVTALMEVTEDEEDRDTSSVLYQAEALLMSLLGLSTVAELFRWNDSQPTKYPVLVAMRAAAYQAQGWEPTS